VKIIGSVIEFGLHLLKRAILLAIIGVVMAFVLVIFTIIMPNNVLNAIEIIKSLFA